MKKGHPSLKAELGAPSSHRERLSSYISSKHIAVLHGDKKQHEVQSCRKQAQKCRENVTSSECREIPKSLHSFWVTAHVAPKHLTGPGRLPTSSQITSVTNGPSQRLPGGPDRNGAEFSRRLKSIHITAASGTSQPGKVLGCRRPNTCLDIKRSIMSHQQMTEELNAGICNTGLRLGEAAGPRATGGEQRAGRSSQCLVMRDLPAFPATLHSSSLLWTPTRLKSVYLYSH